MKDDVPLPEVDPATAKRWLDAREAVLIDVREAPEFGFESVPGSLLLPLSVLEPTTFPPLNETKVILMCAVGRRSATAQARLTEAGFGSLYNMTGGMRAWKEAGLPVQTGEYEEIDFSI